ncbi:D-amino acid aminotransferase [Campylobacter blaseri]|uniref:branched-chain-amino-acid transaminase n=1 Tax=Campylobacter blaseri TaxID=2042961 RepID=A0A2P8QZN4_9BACT|nr:D-amino acid aminotransferase [Campylobacter blaseri]PSM51700.1 D-amino acid aminotransferase [Campylobacter blaseri]PSM53490.1 D-amino acid aminotransferase [Campylobacter blaseri]QKF86295.1 D-amino acid aminotransferase [Campylobacter blaseri]
MAGKLKDIVYLNGQFLNKDKARVSVFDRGFLLGDGIYEVVPIVNSHLTNIEDFFERFENSLSKINLKLPLKKDEILKVLYELISKNTLKEGAVYIQVTRGVAPREFHFIENLEQTFMAFVYEKDVINDDHLETGVKAITSEDIRWKRRDIKSISLLAQCMSKTEAKKNGAFECIMVENGYITEGSSSSIFIVKDDVLITKPLSNEILPGIRRKNLLKFAKVAGLKTDERNFTLDELYSADEVFMSAATLVLLPIVEVDGKLINNGKIGKYSKKLREIYVQDLKKQTGLL